MGGYLIGAFSARRVPLDSRLRSLQTQGSTRSLRGGAHKPRLASLVFPTAVAKCIRAEHERGNEQREK